MKNESSWFGSVFPRRSASDDVDLVGELLEALGEVSTVIPGRHLFPVREDRWLVAVVPSMTHQKIDRVVIGELDPDLVAIAGLDLQVDHLVESGQTLDLIAHLLDAREDLLVGLTDHRRQDLPVGLTEVADHDDSGIDLQVEQASADQLERFEGVQDQETVESRLERPLLPHLYSTSFEWRCGWFKEPTYNNTLFSCFVKL